MDEARRILERLDRIDALREGGADAATLLRELRALLRDGEAWVAAEGPAARRAADALECLGEAIRPGGKITAAPGRKEVVAGSAAL